jgi:hypothetical protein
MLVAGPHGIVADRKRVVVRARFAARVLLVFDSDVGLQGVALGARVGVSAEEGAEADEFGELAEEGVDDGEVGDYDGDEGLAAGPETAADCAFWAGLEGLVLVGDCADVFRRWRTYSQDCYSSDCTCQYDEHGAAEQQHQCQSTSQCGVYAP